MKTKFAYLNPSISSGHQYLAGSRTTNERMLGCRSLRGQPCTLKYRVNIAVKKLVKMFGIRAQSPLLLFMLLMTSVLQGEVQAVQVHLIPHAHCDAGYRETVAGYYR